MVFAFGNILESGGTFLKNISSLKLELVIESVSGLISGVVRDLQMLFFQLFSVWLVISRLLFQRCWVVSMGLYIGMLFN